MRKKKKTYKLGKKIERMLKKSLTQLMKFYMKLN